MNKLNKGKNTKELKGLQLDSEEKEILRAIESGNYTVVKNVTEEIAKAKETARNSLHKDISN